MVILQIMLLLLLFNSLNDLASFVKVTIAGLSVTIPEGDYKALVEVMGHLFAVKERQEGTDTMFEPLKQTIELLKSYGQPLPEDTDQQMIVRLWAHTCTYTYAYTHTHTHTYAHTSTHTCTCMRTCMDRTGGGV